MTNFLLTPASSSYQIFFSTLQKRVEKSVKEEVLATHITPSTRLSPKVARVAQNTIKLLRTQLRRTPSRIHSWSRSISAEISSPVSILLTLRSTLTRGGRSTSSMGRSGNTWRQRAWSSCRESSSGSSSMKSWNMHLWPFNRRERRSGIQTSKSYSPLTRLLTSKIRIRSSKQSTSISTPMKERGSRMSWISRTKLYTSWWVRSKSSGTSFNRSPRLTWITPIIMQWSRRSSILRTSQIIYRNHPFFMICQ